MDPEKILSNIYHENLNNPEQAEQLDKIVKNVLDCFGWQPDKESFLFITDTKVMEVNHPFVNAVRNKLDEMCKINPRAKGAWEMVVVPATDTSATPLGEYVGKKMKDCPVLIATSTSKSHSAETGAAFRGDISDKSVFDEILSNPKFIQTVESGRSAISPDRLKEYGGVLPESSYEKMKILARQTRSRIISITKAHNPFDILTAGAVEETVANLRERAERLNNIMAEVDMVHMTSPKGTDLWLKNNPNYKEVEDGDITKPGSLSNYPIGEWSCSPDLTGSTGKLVVDGPIGGGYNQDKIDKGGELILTFKDGQIVDIQGGQATVDFFKNYLNSGNNDKNHAFRLAELGIGTNAMALKDKPRNYWGTSEGEKVYGTIHIAVGSNGTFGRGKDDPYHNAASIHCDMVLGLNSENKVTVECQKKDGSRFDLIKNGEPQGY